MSSSRRRRLEDDLLLDDVRRDAVDLLRDDVGRARAGLRLLLLDRDDDRVLAGLLALRDLAPMSTPVTSGFASSSSSTVDLTGRIAASAAGYRSPCRFLARDPTRCAPSVSVGGAHGGTKDMPRSSVLRLGRASPPSAMRVGSAPVARADSVKWSAALPIDPCVPPSPNRGAKYNDTVPAVNDRLLCKADRHARAIIAHMGASTLPPPRGAAAPARP